MTKNWCPNSVVSLKGYRTCAQGSQLAACAIMPTSAFRGALTAEYAKAHIHATRVRVLTFIHGYFNQLTYD